MNDQHVLFFDIDGVLIEPHGYRKATIETIQRFLSTLGFSNVAIDETEIAVFEAQGISSEWDIIPLFILAWLESHVNLHTNGKSVQSWSSFCKLLEVRENNHPNTLDITSQYKQFLIPQLNSSEAFYYSQQNNPLIKTIFPQLISYPWVWKELLHNNRDINQAPLSRNLQSLVVGSKNFSERTWLDCDVEGESYLLSHDIAQLNEESITKLQSLVKNDQFHFAAVTARLSANFLKDHRLTSPHLYFPEAEIGLQRAGVADLPVVGYGEIQYLSMLLNQFPSQYAKPGYIHSFLALSQALHIDLEEIFSFLTKELISGQKYIHLQNLSNTEFSHFINGDSIHFHIFEDSCSGIQSVRGMQAMFYANGIHAYVHAYGIGKDKRKIEALVRENASIYPSINEALSTCFEKLN